LYLSYALSMNNIDIFISKKVEVPNEKEYEIKKLNARPKLIQINSGTEDGWFKDNYIYVTMSTKKSLEITVTAQFPLLAGQ